MIKRLPKRRIFFEIYSFFPLSLKEDCPLFFVYKMIRIVLPPEPIGAKAHPVQRSVGRTHMLIPPASSKVLPMADFKLLTTLSKTVCSEGITCLNGSVVEAEQVSAF